MPLGTLALAQRPNRDHAKATDAAAPRLKRSPATPSDTQVVACHQCRHHVDASTRYLTNRLKELKQERFAKVFGSAPGGPAPRADGSMPGAHDHDARATFQS